MRREFLKLVSLSLFYSLLVPINSLLAVTKKIINKNLSKEQRDIMFNEGTERPFSSDLNKEKRNCWITRSKWCWKNYNILHNSRFS